VTFQNEKGEREHAWATSWGASTRLIGGLIMTHSDDTGLVVPPRLAPTHVVICPLGKTDEERAPSVAAAEKLAAAIRDLPRDEFYDYQALTVKIDTAFHQSPGFRFAEWELRGVPVRVELGPKDLEKNACVVGRRDRPGKEGKQMGVPLEQAPQHIDRLLREIQQNLYDKAKAYRAKMTRHAETYDQFKQLIEEPGFIWAHWDGTRETEDRIQEETKATIRCIPFDRTKEEGKDMLTGKPSAGRVVFARAY
jgi:prolyl-tRNA synthetase